MYKKIPSIFMMSLLCACAGSFDKANESFTKDFNAGQYEKAATEMANTLKAENKNGKPQLKDSPYLAGLQIGTASLFSKNYTNSMKYFDIANSSVKAKDTDGYDAKTYEKIMYNTYFSISAMNADPDNARVYINKASKAQKQAKNENKKSIEKLTEKNKEEEKNKESAENFLKEMGVNFDGIIADINSASASEDTSVALPQCKTNTDGHRSDAEQKALADYTNIYTTWLYNLVDSSAGKYNIDDQNFLIANLCGRNKYVYDDSDVASSNKPTVWVVFENGLVGSVESHTMQFPNPFDLNKQITSPLKIKWAVLKENPAPYTALKINNDVNTEFLASMDSIVDRNLKDMKTSYIVKSALWEIGKIAVAAKLCHKDDCSPLSLAMAIGALATEYPFIETRSWTSLPKEVQMARIDMPSNRKLDMSLLNENGTSQLETVNIPDDINQAIVTVRMPTVGAKPSVIITKLK